MKYSRLGLLALFSAHSFCSVFATAWAQQREGYRDFATPQVRSDKLAAPEHLRNYVVEGKLSLSLRDAVVAHAGKQQLGESSGNADRLVEIRAAGSALAI